MRAILQVADTGPLESLVIMLRSVGIDCYLPDERLKGALRSLNCDTVLDINTLVDHWGYDKPMRLPGAGVAMMQEKDVVYVDVKAHRNGPKVWAAWPNLKDRTLWYRINGGKPEHVVNERGDHGDEVNPPCPVLTPNRWYMDPKCIKGSPYRFYSCWPPFYRFDEYYPRHGRSPVTEPICLIHRVEGWGYGALLGKMRSLGVKVHGLGSPDGLLNHRNIPQKLSTALCMVHLKSSDAPGYALYEALAAGCPIICTRRLIWRSRMQELFIPGETCLVFDRETHDGLTEKDIVECNKEVAQALVTLSDPEENRRIGMNGRNRLREIMWSEGRKEDVDSLARFIGRWFK